MRGMGAKTSSFIGDGAGLVAADTDAGRSAGSSKPTSETGVTDLECVLDDEVDPFHRAANALLASGEDSPRKRLVGTVPVDGGI